MQIFNWLLSSLLLLNAAAAHLPRDEKLEHAQSVLDLSRSTVEHDYSSIIEASPLLSLHRALVEVSSISSNESSVGQLLVSTLEAHDFQVIKQKVPDENNVNTRWNIFATPNIKKGSSQVKKTPKVILTSHIDTVPPYIAYKVSQGETKSREDLIISGRGTVDAKACVAAQIISVLNLLASSKDVDSSDIALLFVVSEETNGAGMKNFSDSDLYSLIKDSGTLSAVIFGEPTEGKLASGHKGISMAHIVAKGKAAHSGYPWLGRSANSMIIPTLMVLDKLGDLLPEEGGLPRSEKYGNSTVNVGYMSGGVAANVVPAHAEASVAFRLAGGTPESVKRTILNAIKGADPAGGLEVDIFQGYGPVPLDTDVEGFDSMVVNYGTDVPNLDTAQGVKRYLYGPGSILVAHGDDEALTVGELESSVEAYERLIKHALGL